MCKMYISENEVGIYWRLIQNWSCIQQKIICQILDEVLNVILRVHNQYTLFYQVIRRRRERYGTCDSLEWSKDEHDIGKEIQFSDKDTDWTSDKATFLAMDMGKLIEIIRQITVKVWFSVLLFWAALSFVNRKSP